MAHPGPDHDPDAALPCQYQPYHQASSGQTSHSLFTAALHKARELGLCSPTALAIDLGCGRGADTLALIEQGWQVLAVDQDPAAVQAVIDLVPAPWQARLETQVSAFEALGLPPAQLIYAGFSLSCCPPHAFERFWERLRMSLVPGGLFAAHFAGPRDSAADAAGALTLHTEAGLVQRLQGWDVMRLEEVEGDELTPAGLRHRHHFTVLAMRPF